MKAAILQGPGVVRVQEVPEPVVGDYDALCTMVAASVCSGTDNHALAFDPYFSLSAPALFGHEGIGRVTAVGPKVRNLRIGDLVTRVVNAMPADSGILVPSGWGAFAERGIATDWQAMRDDGLPETAWRAHTYHRTLPAHFDPLAATMIITWRETLAYIKRFSLSAGESLLLVGSGANSLSMAEHAKAMGVQVAVVGSPDREAVFSAAGAASYVSYKIDHPSAVLVAGGTKTVDAIIDTVGRHATANALLPLLRGGGSFGLYGLDEGNAYALRPTLAQGDFRFLSGTEYEEGSTHDEIVAAVENGRLDAWRYLSREYFYPLTGIAEALQATRERKAMKSVIVF
ncbi:MAG: zinc-binding dehydrogenase [Patescibacteria group bacterium]